MERLKQLRIKKGLSQARLAASAELDPSTVNQIERGAREASPSTLRKLADALGVSLYELMEEESPKAQAPSGEPKVVSGAVHISSGATVEATPRVVEVPLPIWNEMLRVSKGRLDPDMWQQASELAHA